MSRPIVFIDTETTALGRHARPWEIAVIRREVVPGYVARPAPAVEESEHVLQVRYMFHELPEGTSADALRVGRWLERGAPGTRYLVDIPPLTLGREVDVYGSPDEEAVARHLATLLEGEPVLVGVGVHFDAAVLSSMFLRHGLSEEPWHYGIVDLKAATWGVLNDSSCNVPDSDVTRAARQLPLSSLLLSDALSVELPDDDERHTALGDARWARRWFDELTGVEQ